MAIQKRQSFFAYIGIAFTFAFSWVVAAQENVSDEDPAAGFEEAADLSLEDIMNVKVSVASLFQERELDVGASVGSITSDQWNRQGARRTFDALSMVPGTVVLPSLGSSQAIAIRGYASNLSTTGIAVLLDGVPLNSFSTGTALFGKSNFDLGTLDKIEMIRGPGSTIYGSDAFHGVVSMLSQESDKDSIVMDGNGGALGYYQAALKVNQSIGGKWRYSLAYSSSGQDGEYQSYEYQEFTAEDVTVPHPTLPGVDLVVTDPDSGKPLPIYRVGDRKKAEYRRYFNSNTLVTKLHHDKAEIGFYWNRLNATGHNGATPTIFLTETGTPRPAVDPDGNPVGNTPYGWSDLIQNGSQIGERSDFWMAKASNTWDLTSGIELDTVAYHWNNNLTFNTGRTPGDTVELLKLTDKDARTGVGIYAKRAADDSFPVQWVVGYTLDYSKVLSSTAQQSEIQGGAVVPDGADGMSRSVNAVLAQTSTGFFDRKLTLHAGARYDVYSDTEDHLSPRGGLVYSMTEDSAAKLLYSHAFRAPFAGELSGKSVIRGNPDLKPETLDMLELLYMKQAKSWKAEAGVFTSLWKNTIVTRTRLDFDPDPSGRLYIAEFANAQLGRSYGLEASGRVDVTEKTTLVANGSWTWSFSQGTRGEPNPYVNFPRGILNWGVEQRISSWNLSLALYNRHMIGWQTRAHEVNAAGSKYKGALPIGYDWADPSERTDFRLSDYFRTDLSAAWDFKIRSSQYQLTLDVRNLLNRRNVVPSIWNQLDGGIAEVGISGTVGVRAAL